jgi:co-chaperonin GroES (HSP10)
MIAIGKYIIVSTIEEEVRTESGLLLSAQDANDLRYKRAVVVSPGTDVTSIMKGDEVYYDKVHSFAMLIGDGKYTVIRESDVVVVSSRGSS